MRCVQCGYNIPVNELHPDSARKLILVLSAISKLEGSVDHSQLCEEPRHDVGSVDNIVRQYMRQRAGGPMASRSAKGRDAGSGKKKNNKKGKN